MLEKLNVDVIEAGFAAASQGDFLSIQAVSNAVKGPIICSLCRAIQEDIDAAVRALSQARRARIHVVLSTSDIHLRYKLNMTQAQALKRAIESVQYAKKFCPDVQFTAEDAGRTDPGFLVRMISAVIEAGASTVNLSDTIGHCMPEEFKGLVTHVREKVSGLDHALLSVHVHDDLGLALASTLAAVQAGADQAECTVNGIGDRAGICALEELVAAIKIRQDYMPEVFTDIREEFIIPASKLVAKATCSRVAYNKPVVGQGAVRAGLLNKGHPALVN
jgi:2-isopropylmalate synthase